MSPTATKVTWKWFPSALLALSETHVEAALADIIRMDASSIALQGLQQADIQLEEAATKIASADAGSPDGATLDVVDLSAEMVALMSAQNLFDLNLATLKTADQMKKSLIDITA